MGIIDTIKNWFSPTVQASVDESDVQSLFGTNTSASGVAVSSETAMRVSTVYACVEILAGGISTLPVNIYKTDGVSRTPIPRDELWYQLNESPCQEFSSASAWENVSINNSLRGDAFWLIRRRMDGSVKDLFPLPHSTVAVQRMPGGSVRYYVNYADYGICTWFDPQDILHFPGLGFDGLKSMSVIKYAARNAIGNASAMDEYSGQFFAGGAHPSLILRYPDKMTKERIEQLQQQFLLKYSGIGNFHKTPLVLTDGGDAKEVSLSAEDSQLLDARKFQVIDICRAFGVPPHMVGATDASTSWGSGIEAMSRGFFTYTLRPRLVRIEQELNRKLFPNDSSYRIEFDRDAFLEGDSQAQANYYRSALGGPGTGRGWMTVDEIRERKNLSPMGGVFSEIYDPQLVEDGNVQQNSDVQ